MSNNVKDSVIQEIGLPWSVGLGTDREGNPFGGEVFRGVIPGEEPCTMFTIPSFDDPDRGALYELNNEDATGLALALFCTMNYEQQQVFLREAKREAWTPTDTDYWAPAPTDSKADRNALAPSAPGADAETVCEVIELNPSGRRQPTTW